MKIKTFIVALALLCAFLFYSPPAHAQSTYVVMQSAAAGTGNGTPLNMRAQGQSDAASIRITGSGTWTVTFEATIETDGTGFTAVSGFNLATQSTATTATAAGWYTVLAPKAAQVRARVSAWSNGTVTVKGKPTTGIVSKNGSGGGGSGTVTEVDTGEGLAGGPLTTTGTLSWDPSTMVSNVNLWDASQASRTLTANLSGATDPVITFGNNSIDVTTGVLKVGGNTVAVSTNNLSFFASTTSAQFLGIISNETGSGLVVGNDTPTLITPVLGVATGTSLNLSGAATIGTNLNSCVDAGSNDTYACNISPAPTAYSANQPFWFQANTANTGAATVNFNSLGAKTIKKVAGGVTTDLSDNDIRAGQWVELRYDGTNMQMISQLGNASSASGADPSASVGLSAVNGSASTFLRSDGAPALSQAIAPTWTGVHTFSPTARSSGVAPYLKVTTPADTAQTLNTEFPGIVFGGDSSNATVTRTGADGTTYALQREYIFVNPTYAFAGATTVTNVATVAIPAAPAQGTNATLTNRYALMVGPAPNSGDSVTEAIFTSSSQTRRALTLQGARAAGNADPLMAFTNFTDGVVYLSALSDGTMRSSFWNLAGGGIITSQDNIIGFATSNKSGGTLLSGNGGVWFANIGSNATRGMTLSNDNGMMAPLTLGYGDSGTNTVGTALTIDRRSSGTPAAGLGGRILFNINSSTTADQNAVAIDALWSVATHASRSADIVFSNVDNANALAEKMRLTSVGNLKIGGTAARGTTEGTNEVVIFDGTAPVGTLSNGISLYSTSGELRVMDAAGNATLLSPHDHATNEWIFFSLNTQTGKVLKIDMERMMRFLNAKFGTDFVHEYASEAEARTDLRKH